MSKNLINVRQLYRDTLGNPRSEGWLYFYENRTTTLAKIYSDDALTIEQSNPYQLDSYGMTAGDIKFNGKLSVKHTNSNGSLPLTDHDVETLGSSTSDAYSNQFQATESSPQAMTVELAAGKVLNGETLATVAAQTTTVITAPTTNPRIDRIVINRLTGAYQIVTGAEAASPTAPAIPVDRAPICQFRLETSTTIITDAMIVDERLPGILESNANSTETVTNKTIGDTNTINAQDDAFTIDDSVDATKQIDFNAGGATSTKTTIAASQTANRTVTLPDATDTLVGKATTDTLTNKTIGDTNTINAQTDAFTIDDATTPTKQVDVNISGAVASTKTTLEFNQTVNRTITFPNTTGTLVTTNSAVSLANKTIGDTNTINAQTDAFTIDDATTATKQVDFDLSGATASTKTTLKFNQTADRTIIFPDYTSGGATTLTSSSTNTGGTGSAGAGNQYVEIEVGGTVYKVLHDGTV